MVIRIRACAIGHCSLFVARCDKQVPLVYTLVTATWRSIVWYYYVCIPLGITTAAPGRSRKSEKGYSKGGHGQPQRQIQ